MSKKYTTKLDQFEDRLIDRRNNQVSRPTAAKKPNLIKTTKIPEETTTLFHFVTTTQRTTKASTSTTARTTTLPTSTTLRTTSILYPSLSTKRSTTILVKKDKETTQTTLISDHPIW